VQKYAVVEGQLLFGSQGNAKLAAESKTRFSLLAMALSFIGYVLSYSTSGN
jgi:hypothetical protein